MHKKLLTLIITLCLLAVLPVGAVFAQDDGIVYHSTVEEAAADVRQQLIAGENPVVVGFAGEYSEQTYDSIEALAFAPTGNVEEDDYISNHCHLSYSVITPAEDCFYTEFYIDYIPDSNSPDAGIVHHTTVEEAAADMRQQLVDGENAVVVGYRGKYSEEIAASICDLAFAHTGDPKEGDYLKHNIQSVSRGTTDTEDGFYITLYVKTAITPAQNAQVDTKVAQILSTVRQDTDYHKVLDIYRWFQKNTSYLILMTSPTPPTAR